MCTELLNTKKTATKKATQHAGHKADTKERLVACNSKHGCGGRVKVNAKGNIVEGDKDTGRKAELI